MTEANPALNNTKRPSQYNHEFLPIVEDGFEEIKAEVDEVFETMDENGDGTISAEEAAHFGVTKEEFMEIDYDGDGRITKDELLRAATESAGLDSTCGSQGRLGQALTDVDYSSMTADQLKKEIRKQVQDIVVNRSGPSFEERSAKAAARFKREALSIERRQNADIQDAVRRGRERPNSSAVRENPPESVESRAKRGVKAVKAFSESNLHDLQNRIKDRLDNKPPLFSLAEVEAAQQMLKERQAQRKRELTEEEEERWKMLRTLQARVLSKPLSMQQFRKNPVSALDLKKMANPPEKPMGVDLKIQIGVTKKSFLESSWCAEVKNIKQRADSRPGLHEIQYPKIDPVKPPPRPKSIGPLEKLIDAAVQSRDFKTSEYYTKNLAELKEKMNTREKLHEFSYPPKPWKQAALDERTKVEEPSPLRAKIQADMDAKVEARRIEMVAAERNQRRLLRAAIAEGLVKRKDAGGITRPLAHR